MKRAEIPWESTGEMLAERCQNGTANEIRDVLTREGRTWDQIPELVEETLDALGEQGKIDVIRHPLLC